MDTNNYIFIILIVLVVALGVWIIMGSRKRKWFKVYLANNDVMLLYRELNERWWRSSGAYLRFRDEQGNEVSFLSNGHWIIKMVEVRESELNHAREEIIKIREARLKEE